MYKIIGADQKEYGPVSSDQIRQWIISGRVNAQTKAQMEGGEWKTLGDFPEFAALFGSNPGAPPMAPPPPFSAQPTKISGLAITSLVLGILGFCGITALIGLILGIVAMIQVRKSKGAIGGGGIALAGTIVSAVFLLFIPLGAAMLLPALSAAKQRAQTIQCVNNMRQLSMAAHIYADSHQDHFPAASNWCDELKESVGNSANVYKCPAGNSTARCNYSYNSRVAGLDVKNVNPQTVLFFESSDGWNLSGGVETLLNEPRHRSRGRKQVITVAFADGHVEEVAADRIPQLRWEP